MTVTGKITAWYLILAIAPILAIGFIAYQNSRTTLEREIKSKLNAVADDKSETLRGWLKEHAADVNHIAQSIAVRDLLSPSFRIVYPNLTAKTAEERIRRVRDLITVVQETNAPYVDILILDQGGTIVLSSSRILEQEGGRVREVDLTAVDKSVPFVSSVFYSSAAQQHVFMMGSPVHDNNANVVGHAVLEVSLRPIHALVEQRSGLGETGEVLLIDRDHSMITQSRFSEKPTILERVGLPAELEGAFERKVELLTYADYRSVPVMASVRPVPELNSMLIAKMDQAEGFSPVTSLRRSVFLMIVLAIIVASWVALRVAEITTRPIVRAQELERLKADFTAMVVHDLRSPLANVILAVQMIKEGVFGPVNDEQRRWLVKVEASSRELVDFVSNFLDLSKIEAGRLELAREAVNLEDIVRGTLESFLLLAGEKKIRLETRIEPGLPVFEADPRRVGQVLTNLLSNAVKFTAEGGRIEVGARRHGGEIEVWVSDTGVGIAREDLGHLFEVYRQAAGGRHSTEAGTGLGLVICKMIVEAHGGRIDVESEEGKGSTFRFWLPASPEQSRRWSCGAPLSPTA
ncbi:MAG TPA: sensor histidine kinase [candidate division Zixibacteria bacterium]|nr:sensor histidine kinase [candidate division Zixibacteria bacterium]